MARSAAPRKKHRITWDQFKAFASASGRDLTHAYRVFRRERESAVLEASFAEHFGFRMEDAELAGRHKTAAA